MRLRPVDASGDILPVRTGRDMVSGPAAAALLAEYRLKLFAGEWWENPEHGNELLQLLQETRLTEADAEALASYLSSYLLETPGVREVTGASVLLSGTALSFRCALLTDEGAADLSIDF